MTTLSISQIAGQIVALIENLTPEERKRVLNAALLLVGDTPVAAFDQPPVRAPAEVSDVGGENGDTDGLPRKAQTWVAQNKLTREMLDQVFHINNDEVDLIASTLPGKNGKEKTINTYLLTGISKLLGTGEPQFDDNAARSNCERLGAYNVKHHSTYLKEKGNDISGTKDKGWTLTSPGLKNSAALVRQIATGEN